jgi:hypothetical protein
VDSTVTVPFNQILPFTNPPGVYYDTFNWSPISGVTLNSVSVVPVSIERLPTPATQPCSDSVVMNGTPTFDNSGVYFNFNLDMDPSQPPTDTDSVIVSFSIVLAFTFADNNSSASIGPSVTMSSSSFGSPFAVTASCTGAPNSLSLRNPSVEEAYGYPPDANFSLVIDNTAKSFPGSPTFNISVRVTGSSGSPPATYGTGVILLTITTAPTMPGS